MPPGGLKKNVSKIDPASGSDAWRAVAERCLFKICSRHFF
jgi:hypothetical protein